MGVKFCLLNKITLVVVGDIYSRHMFRTLGTSQLNMTMCEIRVTFAGNAHIYHMSGCARFILVNYKQDLL